MVERKAGDEDGVRLTDGVLNRVPQLIVPRRAAVLIVKREPDRHGTKKRARAAVLLAPCSGGLPRELKAKATIPRARRLDRIRVACENRNERNGGA
jgi:hypothetical protein